MAFELGSNIEGNFRDRNWHDVVYGNFRRKSRSHDFGVHQMECSNSSRDFAFSLGEVRPSSFSCLEPTFSYGSGPFDRFVFNGRFVSVSVLNLRLRLKT